MPIFFQILFGSIALIAFGLSDYFGAICSRKIGAFETTMITTIIAFLLLLPVFLIFFTNIPPLAHLTVAMILITALFMIGV